MICMILNLFRSDSLVMKRSFISWGISCHLGFVAFFLFLFSCDRKTDSNEFANRLSGASSPYLREHSDNPVDWHEWGSDALEKARREDKPIIISIGYASCHWCHVMEEESFMDTAVARIMNENFVSIKIDREERPDIDQIYITAAQLITGNAGWPLNAFALPNGKPFYAGTYFTKDQWINLMNQIVIAYRDDNNNLVKQADAITLGILQNDIIKPVSDNNASENSANYKNIFTAMESSLDFSSGGLKGAPKFPMPVVWEFFLQDYYHTKNPRALDAVKITLDKMAKGGIYDHLGGGFSRYSTDVTWQVPHFEKMLYDNGQLVSLYAHAWKITGNHVYADVVHETLKFISKEMTSAEGGFYSSLNADSEGDEGTFYVWTKSEIENTLDKKSADIFIEYYNISEAGNWEDKKNVLHVTGSLEEFARKYNVTPPVLEKTLDDSKGILLAARNKRIHPSLDDKILTSWNALMLGGYVDAYWAFGNPEYLEAAIKNARFIKNTMIRKDGQLRRSYSNGKAFIDAFLDDYALLANAYIKLYQATFDMDWLNQARSLADYAILHFKDEQSGFFWYTSDASRLIVRKMEISDQVIPSSSSGIADVLYQLGHYFEDDTYLKMCEAMFDHIANDILQNGPYYANWARLLSRSNFQSFEVAIMGDEHHEKSQALMKNYLPDVLLMGGNTENLPLLEYKYVAGKTIIYVCRNRVCKQPVTEIDQALDQLSIR